MREIVWLADLGDFIVQAKKKTYAGNANKLLPYRLGSKDIQYINGDWAYHDSYLGDSDFIGQEAVYYQQKPIWAMNYFGYILDNDTFSSAEAGDMIMKSLSKLYTENRFLGAFEHTEGDLRYVDTNNGDLKRFTGKEQIFKKDRLVYELVYHGGMLHNLM